MGLSWLPSRDRFASSFTYGQRGAEEILRCKSVSMKSGVGGVPLGTMFVKKFRHVSI